MKQIILVIVLFLTVRTSCQELFVSTQPASNIPGNSVSAKLFTLYYPFDLVFDRPAYRTGAELAMGVNKNLMFMVGATYSDMHTARFELESYYAYLKYLSFLSMICTSISEWLLLSTDHVQ
jgi:hypothetical protein